jgi:FkbM family methyltransferase
MVYSLGVGDSVAFDLKVIEEAKATVHAFDPTPFAVNWVNSQVLPPQFMFHQWAVASNDGILLMTRRTNRRGKKSKVMWTSVSETANGEDVIEVPCFSLRSIMKKLNHDNIDLLKMDVEGSEYEILEEIISMPDKPAQLLVEFHHRFPEIGIDRTIACIKDLRQVGYKVLSVSATGREISFIHDSQL